ncbi:ammonia-forming cytochrome c nitrite reductase subunit c552 [Mesobacillus maritimus]|uniref:ammonia-forming cytochrome c nitrite reductase subunit c552 n=1 Tax=Mesobacillus maritimus TaxID=1643336 RepID=UPI002040C815|nr:ammonia-forming cytochrome c nitrite reductase subunit c552 [Mesobacillus maritimus]MCM3587945.1 ammonia-forming cytochrome c nitrite reductase subunit c552 [Mesobacillus maritimus]MCM3670119.1 ammonia-forming cytochrome c nitrite reductase subunit c552 [Mesobacillus maritimus]
MARKLKWASLLLVAVMLILSGCGAKEETAANEAKTGLSADEISNEAFKDLFPLQYDSYLKNEEMEDTKYSGSEKRSKFDHDKEPYLPILFNGYGFATEYNEDRGHIYALEDVREIARITDKSVGSCLTCKSTAVPHMIEEMGDDYWGGNFNEEIWPKAESMGHSPIGCSDCHDPETMDLRVTRPSFIKGMEAQGIDMSNPTKNDMRNYVCGQCHVEYYFAADNSEVTYPWDNGFKPEDMYEYYETVAKENGFNQDWIHNVSGTPILKAQHPDFETHMTGPHGEAGVTCSDCHMPYERADGKKKISSHHWQSPLKTMEQSCATCHSNRDLDELEERVMDIQETHMEALHKAEDVSITSHYYVNKMITSGVSENKIKAAQEHVRKGQWFWDIVAAESAAGFHNPQGAMDTLKMSSEESFAAIKLATEELVKKGVNIEELDKEIEKVKKAVYEEVDNFKKKDLATNDYFPAQQPK